MANKKVVNDYTWVVENLNQSKKYEHISPYFPLFTESTLSRTQFQMCYLESLNSLWIRCFNLKSERSVLIEVTLNITNQNNVRLFQKYEKLVLLRHESFQAIASSNELSECASIRNEKTLKFLITIKTIKYNFSPNEEINMSAHESLLTSNSPKVTSNSPKVTSNSPKVTNDLGLLLLSNHKFTDFIIKVDNTDIPVHKAVLVSRSPVFSTMLESNFSEKNIGYVEIKDLDTATVNSMIRFIYTSDEDVLNGKDVLTLFAAADKYELSDLKILCEKYLIDNLELCNVLDVLILADRHNADRITTEGIKYFVDNFDQFSDEAKFQRISQEAPHLMIKLMTEAAKLKTKR